MKDDLLTLTRYLVTKWQPILNLRDWCISPEVCDSPDGLKNGDIDAECDVRAYTKAVVIRINRIRHEFIGHLRNVELSVVHELLHVSTDQWYRLVEAQTDPAHKELNRLMLEQTIESTARGLVNSFGERNRKLRI